MKPANDVFRIMVIDDESNLVHFLQKSLIKLGHDIQAYVDPKSAVEALPLFQPHLVLTDIRMPEMDGLQVLQQVKDWNLEARVILMTAHASVDSTVDAIRQGASDYLVKPFTLDELRGAVSKALSSSRITFDNKGTRSTYEQSRVFDNIVGSSEGMKNVFKLVEKVAASDSTILIQGESGTGKELISKAIHFHSTRKDAPFVSINCAALPEALLESELFGYEKGAFTGAVATKPGLFELAEEGTFFLDEIGELPISLQAKLLRVLQQKEVRHVGGLKDISIDIRLIAATSRDLRKMVLDKTFRADLYYRLNVVPLTLPPLRNRSEDILTIMNHYLAHFSDREQIKKPTLSSEAEEYLVHEFLWPGNVRELENLCERIIMLADSNEVTYENLKLIMEPGAAEKDIEASAYMFRDIPVQDLRIATEQFERDLIQRALRESQGNKYRASRSLNLSRQSLQYKIKKYALDEYDI